jgi:hypothetical protein
MISDGAVTSSDLADRAALAEILDDDGSESGLDADTLDGYHAGNSSGRIPINNGALNTNLNADKLDGKHASDFLSTDNDYGRLGVASNLYEGTTKLSDKYLGKYAKAADSDKLDGKDSSEFLSTSNDYGRYNVASNLYEGTTKLSDKYLGKYAKAADSDKLDGYDSSAFAFATHGHWGASWSGSGIGLTLNSSNHDGLRIESAGDDGVQVTSAAYGFYVESATYDGVYVKSAGDDGVHVKSATDGVQVDSAGDDGVHVKSATDDGVQVDSAGDDGVFVSSVGNDGVYVHSAGSPSAWNTSPYNNGFEVAGAERYGLFVGRADTDGVHVESAGRDGVRVISAGFSGVFVDYAVGYGVYVSSAGDDGVNVESASDDGVYVGSAGHYGVYANTTLTYGFYTPDKIYTGGGCVGCTSMLIAQNGGEEALEPGDVVVVVGLTDPLFPEAVRPILIVRKAETPFSQGIVGVVEGRYVYKLATEQVSTASFEEGKKDTTPSEQVEETIIEEAYPGEPAAPGDYLTVVYRGLVKVKVDAQSSAIKVGDLLTLSSTAGHAMKAQLLTIEGERTAGYHLPGTVIGKALEPLNSGKGLIWVLVDLQ